MPPMRKRKFSEVNDDDDSYEPNTNGVQSPDNNQSGSASRPRRSTRLEQKQKRSIGESTAEAVAEAAPAPESTAEPTATEELTSTEQAVTEPIAAEPVPAEPIAAEPIAAEPIAAEPIAAELIAAEPISAEPAAAEPAAAEPAAVEPIATELLTVGEPVVTEPAQGESAAEVESVAAAEEPVEESSQVEAVASEAGAVEPLVAESESVVSNAAEVTGDNGAQNEAATSLQENLSSESNVAASPFMVKGNVFESSAGLLNGDGQSSVVDSSVKNPFGVVATNIDDGLESHNGSPGAPKAEGEPSFVSSVLATGGGSKTASGGSLYFPGEEGEELIVAVPNCELLKAVKVSEPDVVPAVFKFREVGFGVVRLLLRKAAGSSGPCVSASSSSSSSGRVVFRIKGTWNVLLNSPVELVNRVEKLEGERGPLIKFTAYDTVDEILNGDHHIKVSAFVLKFPSKNERDKFTELLLNLCGNRNTST